MKLISFIFFLLLFVSCGGEGKKRIKKPDNLISNGKMVDIIYDMSLISAAKGVNRKHMEQKGVHPDTYVYKKHDVDSTQFAQSNEYYAFDLNAYEEIYQKVKTKLEKEKKHFSDLVQVEDKERDSISKERLKTRDSLKGIRDLGGIKFEGKKPIGRLKNVDSLKKSRKRQN